MVAKGTLGKESGWALRSRGVLRLTGPRDSPDRPTGKGADKCYRFVLTESFRHSTSVTSTTSRTLSNQATSSSRVGVNS